MTNPKEADELELVRLTDCADNAEAALVQALLEAEGLFVNLSGAHHRSLVTALGSHIRIDVWVQRKDVDRAKTLLAEWQSGELAPADPQALEAEALAAGSEMEDGPEPEQLEAVREASEAQLESAARRRRRVRKLGAWVLMGPVLVMLGLLGYLKVTEFLHLDWVEVKRPQLRVRFPLRPSETSKAITDMTGRSYQQDDYTSFQVESDCRYFLRFVSPRFRDGEEQPVIDGLIHDLRSRLGGAQPEAATVQVQGFPARELITRGTVLGHQVTLRSRWIATPGGTLIQRMVCSEGAFPKRDADAFFSSLKIAP